MYYFEYFAEKKEMVKVLWIIFLWVGVFSFETFAQEAINPFVIEDDTLPIANSRFDDAIEIPQENFFSSGKNDMWEKFERGDLGGKAYTTLQLEYQQQTAKLKTQKRGVASSKKKNDQQKKTKRPPQEAPKKLPSKK